VVCVGEKLLKGFQGTGSGIEPRLESGRRRNCEIAITTGVSWNRWGAAEVERSLGVHRDVIAGRNLYHHCPDEVASLRGGASGQSMEPEGQIGHGRPVERRRKRWPAWPHKPLPHRCPLGKHIPSTLRPAKPASAGLCHKGFDLSEFHSARELFERWGLLARYTSGQRPSQGPPGAPTLIR